MPEENQIHHSPSSRSQPWIAYALSLLLVSAITFAGEFVKQEIEPANLVAFYLLAVVIAAVRWGRGPAIWTSLLGVLAFDFFLIPPYLTLGVSDVQYLFTFVGFLIVGLMISEFTAKSRRLELLSAKEKLQTALLNSISHDLRTPLVSITGTMSILLHDTSWLDEETKKELLENAYGESDRLNRIVGNLLDMSRVEAGALKISIKPCELRDVIGVALQELRLKLDRRTVDMNIPSGFPEIPVDFSLMVKVFVNLIDNAAKYSPENSSISISARREGQKARIEISDQGIGISPDDLRHVFNKFFRAERPEQVSGTGLGLSICKGIVEAHRGQISVESNPSKKGTTFTILLPLEQPTL